MSATDYAQWSWTWLAAGVGAVLFLLGLLWRLFSPAGTRRQNATLGSGNAPGQPRAQASVSDREAQIEKALTAVGGVCKQNDRAAAYTACFAWLKLRFGANSLTSSKLEQISPQLAQQLAAMERALYAEGNQAPWTGKSLWQAIARVTSSGPENGASRSRPEILPPLYPARSNH